MGAPSLRMEVREVQSGSTVVAAAWKDLICLGWAIGI